MQKGMYQCQNLEAINILKNKPVIIIGAGGHAKVVASCAIESGYHVIGFLDDDTNKHRNKIFSLPIFGSIDILKSGKYEHAILGIGDNKKRKALYDQYKDCCNWISVKDPFSYIHSSVEIGEGSVIFAGAIVQPDTYIGSHVIINTGARIDHDCKIEDFVHIAPGCNLAGRVYVQEGAFLGIGCSIIPNITIGKWSIAGAGSVIVKNVAELSEVKGVPAK